MKNSLHLVRYTIHRLVKMYLFVTFNANRDRLKGYVTFNLVLSILAVLGGNIYLYLVKM